MTKFGRTITKTSQLSSRELAARASSNTPIHKIADSFVPRFESRVLDCINRAQGVVSVEQLEHAFANHDERAITTVVELAGVRLRALDLPFDEVLKKSGGQAALALGKVLRTAGDVEGHPFHGNQWTTGIDKLEFAYFPADPHEWEHQGVDVRFKQTGADSFNLVKKNGNVIKEGLTKKDVTALVHGGSVIGDYQAVTKFFGFKTDEEGNWLPLRGAQANIRTLAPVIPFLPIAFDVTNPLALLWITHHTGELITGFADVSGIRKIIARAFNEGIPPKSAAQLIRSVIGLTERQGDAVINLANWIRRSAGLTVQAGSKTIRVPSKGADEAFITKQTNAYADRLKKDRALMIARTETLKASNRGQRMLWEQAIEKGLLSDDDERIWIATPDERTCDECEPLDGEHVTMDEEFSVGEDPPIHPNCRCTVGLAPRRAVASEEGTGLQVETKTKKRMAGEHEGHEFHGNQYTDARDAYKTSKGTDAKVNEELVKGAGLHVTATEALRADVNEALAHLVSDKFIATQMKGMKVEVTDLGRRYGTMKGKLYLDAASFKSEGPGFMAAVAYHELQHSILTKQGVPSGQQEMRVRAATKMWASIKAGSMATTNPRASRGFEKAMKASHS